MCALCWFYLNIERLMINDSKRRHIFFFHTRLWKRRKKMNCEHLLGNAKTDQRQWIKANIVSHGVDSMYLNMSIFIDMTTDLIYSTIQLNSEAVDRCVNYGRTAWDLFQTIIYVCVYTLYIIQCNYENWRVNNTA